MGRKTADLKTAFIQKLIRELRSIPLLPRKILIAVSGGADSVALLVALNEVKTLFQLELVVAHVHHGLVENRELNKFRIHSKQFVRELTSKKELLFVSNQEEDIELCSEAELRKYRYDFLTRWQKEQGCDAIALGHHFEDLLETQMMRLFRGSAQLGLSAMSVLSAQKRLRPFLNFKKEELVLFLEKSSQTWVEDPSNLSEKPLRNQVRQWLGQIEQAYPGAQVNLSKSLQRLVRLNQEMKHPWKEEALTKGGIQRSVYISLSEPQKTELLAYYIRQNGLKNYTSGQIHELMKRLDVTQKEIKFKFLGRDWAIKPKMIKIVSDV